MWINGVNRDNFKCVSDRIEMLDEQDQLLAVASGKLTVSSSRETVYVDSGAVPIRTAQRTSVSAYLYQFESEMVFVERCTKIRVLCDGDILGVVPAILQRFGENEFIGESYANFEIVANEEFVNALWEAAVSVSQRG